MWSLFFAGHDILVSGTMRSAKTAIRTLARLMHWRLRSLANPGTPPMRGIGRSLAPSCSPVAHGCRAFASIRSSLDRGEDSREHAESEELEQPVTTGTTRFETPGATASERRSRVVPPTGAPSKTDRIEVVLERLVSNHTPFSKPGIVIIHCWHCRGTTGIVAPRLSDCHLSAQYCGQTMKVSDLRRGLSCAPRGSTLCVKTR